MRIWKYDKQIFWLKIGCTFCNIAPELFQGNFLSGRQCWTIKNVPKEAREKKTSYECNDNSVSDLGSGQFLFPRPWILKVQGGWYTLSYDSCCFELSVCLFVCLEKLQLFCRWTPVHVTLKFGLQLVDDLKVLLTYFLTYTQTYRPQPPCSN